MVVVASGGGPKRRWSAAFRRDAHLRYAIERDGLVKRTVFPTTPQRVDYELTKLGSTLWQAVEPLTMGRDHVGDRHVAEAIRREDAANRRQARLPMVQAIPSARAFRRMTRGGRPKARRKAWRIRSRIGKPVCRATPGSDGGCAP